MALGCEKNLHPVWVREGDDNVEALSVVISVKEMKIRCCVAYGPQETDLVERKNAFWEYLHEEVLQAKYSGTGLIFHFDGNLWAGSAIIPGDPRPQNKNGQIFEQFLKQNPSLTVVNTLPLCEGLITRRRFRDEKLEESILDFFVVCDKVLPFVTKMIIDEKKKFVLTNYERVKKGKKASDSDHATQILDVNLNIRKEKPERRELFNFKDVEAQQKFKSRTSMTKDFTDCFQNNMPLEYQIEKWREVFEEKCSKSFKKIRIRKRRTIKPINAQISQLITLRNSLKSENELNQNTGEIDKLEEKISELEAEENRNIIIKHFKSLSDDPEKVNLTQMWKNMRKIWPKNKNNLPSSKKNHQGKLITDPMALKLLLSKEYKERLRSRPIREDLKEKEKYKMNIFDLKMTIASMKKSKEWTILDIEKALKDLKLNKSRDHEGLINEIFKEDVIGTDLKKSLLIMFNRIKRQQLIPQFMNISNITTVPKSGSKLDLRNERGIFRVSVLRSILMRLIYNSNYPNIDGNISDCQMGGRKEKNCKNNIFIINGIIYEVLKTKRNKPVTLQIYDYAQMFDSMNLQKSINDIYDAGLRDDNLILVQKANHEIKMAVNTPSGLTERSTIRNCVLQGDTWGSLLASVQVDTIGQECEESGLGYQYKDQVMVTMLGMVDDIIGVSEAGYKAQQLNTIINTKTAEKGLQFGVHKCKTMVIGKSSENIHKNHLEVDKWEIVRKDENKTGKELFFEEFNGQVPIEKTEEQKYLGFVLSSKGNNLANINHMKNKSHGIIRTIFRKLESLNLKQYYFECAVIMMNAMLRSSIYYASETYYDLKENKIRKLERIEEVFLRKLFKTSTGCPISLLYLEAGVVPGRFEIIKTRLLYLKYILMQKENSRIYQFFKAQQNKPEKKDWVSTCKKNIEDLNLNVTFEEIKAMKDQKFRKMIKEQIRKKALEYLKEKTKSKGKEIDNETLHMADYLLPYCKNMSITEKQEVFAMRTRMTNIPENFKTSNKLSKCVCDQPENMSHIYECKTLNRDEITTKYENIFKDDIEKIRKIYERFRTNMKNREVLQKQSMKSENSHETYVIGPLFSVPSIVNGNG